MFFQLQRRNQRYGYTHAHSRLSRQTGGRGEEDTQSCGWRYRQSGSQYRYSAGPKWSKITEGVTGRQQSLILARNMRVLLGLCSEPQLLFRRDFSDKMADTPLPQRCNKPKQTYSLLQTQPRWALSDHSVWWTKPSAACPCPRSGSMEPVALTLTGELTESRGLSPLVSGAPLRSLPACSDIFTGTRGELLRSRNCCTLPVPCCPTRAAMMSRSNRLNTLENVAWWY